jgi:hypothetical protein
MATGTTYKMCGCRDAGTGRLLRTKCPKLCRGDGRWSSKHGRWYYQLELPPYADGRRRNPLRRGGFTGQDAAEDELNQARELLGIGADDACLKAGPVAGLGRQLVVRGDRGVQRHSHHGSRLR